MTTEEQIWICAFRYALGRRTYITAVVSEYLMGKVSLMSEQCKQVIQRDLWDTDDFGDGCDKDAWMNLRIKLGEKNE